MDPALTAAAPTQWTVQSRVVQRVIAIRVGHLAKLAGMASTARKYLLALLHCIVPLVPATTTMTPRQNAKPAVRGSTAQKARIRQVKRAARPRTMTTRILRRLVYPVPRSRSAHQVTVAMTLMASRRGARLAQTQSSQTVWTAQTTPGQILPTYFRMAIETLPRFSFLSILEREALRSAERKRAIILTVRTPRPIATTVTAR